MNHKENVPIAPQAKGRVERGHGTHQDRLVKKLRLRRINSYEEANRYLRQGYWAEHNRRYERKAAGGDYHLRRPCLRQLDAVFCLQQERVVSQDWVVSYNGCWLQLERQSRHWAPARSRVTVSEWEDGRIGISYRGQRLPFHEIFRRPAKPPTTADPPALRKQHPQPASHHPWRFSYKAPPPSSTLGTRA